LWSKKKKEKNYAVFYFAGKRFFIYIYEVFTSLEKEKRSTIHYSYVCVYFLHIHITYAQSKVETGVPRKDRHTYEKQPASAEVLSAVQVRVISDKAEQEAAAARKAALLQAKKKNFP
jgi:hypothetical protein